MDSPIFQPHSALHPLTQVLGDFLVPILSCYPGQVTSERREMMLNVNYTRVASTQIRR